MTANEGMSDGESTFRQRRREVQCAVNLEKMLSPLVAAEVDQETFEASIRTQAESLASTALGEELLHVIGYVYELAGQKQLGRQGTLGLMGHAMSIRQKAHIAGTHIGAGAAGVRTWWEQRRMSQMELKDTLDSRRASQEGEGSGEASGAGGGGGGGGSNATTPGPNWEAPPGAPGAGGGTGAAAEAAAGAGAGEQAGAGGTAAAEGAVEGGEKGESAELAAQKAQVMFSFLETLWKFSVLDIEKTLRSACHKLVHDKSVEKEVISARAQALVIVGTIFMNTECANVPVDEAGNRQTWKEQLAQQVGMMNNPGGEAEAPEPPVEQK